MYIAKPERRTAAIRLYAILIFAVLKYNRTPVRAIKK